MLDDTTTPSGRRSGLLGGSAPYAALAAARYCRARVVSIVGTDALPQLETAFAGSDIDTTDLTVSRQPSFHEVTVHEDLNGRTTLQLSEHNCFDGWNPSMSAAAAGAPVCFVGSAPPGMQLRLINQIRARVVGVDTMLTHLTQAAAPALAALRRASVVFLNEQELAAAGELLGIPSSAGLPVTELARRVLEALPGDVLIAKRGPAGVAVASRKETFSLPAAPVRHVRDPTGAGDAFAGGMLGALARMGAGRDLDLATLVQEGLRCAALAVSEFGVAGLARTTAGRGTPK